MQRITFFLFSLCLTVSVFSCSTPESRRVTLQESHPSWNTEKLDKVSHGVIEVGMSKEEVREALAGQFIFQLHTDGNRWTYVDNSRPGRQEEVYDWGKILIFENDRLVQIRTFLRSQDRTSYLEW